MELQEVRKKIFSKKQEAKLQEKNQKVKILQKWAKRQDAEKKKDNLK